MTAWLNGTIIDSSEEIHFILENIYHGMVTICQSWVHLMHGHGVHTGHLVLLLPLHSPVLEPYLDLSFCQTQRMCNLDSENKINFRSESISDLKYAFQETRHLPSSSSQVSIEVKFFLQLQSLVPCVGCSLPLCLPILINSI